MKQACFECSARTTENLTHQCMFTCHWAIFRYVVALFLITLTCSLDINNIRLKYKFVFITSKYFVHQINHRKYLNIFSLYVTSVWDGINWVFTFMRFILRVLLGSVPQKTQIYDHVKSVDIYHTVQDYYYLVFCSYQISVKFCYPHKK
jgi:hypothetical protein